MLLGWDKVIVPDAAAINLPDPVIKLDTVLGDVILKTPELAISTLPLPSVAAGKPEGKHSVPEFII